MSLSALQNTNTIWFWLAWAFALVWQNYAFTRVSRARNSGSIKAHALAALQSNGAWFVQSLFVYSSFMAILTGKAGIWKAVLAGLYYTALTMSGSVIAHYRSLKIEKGKTAVGANAKYAQVPVAEWAEVKSLISAFREGGQLWATIRAWDIYRGEFTPEYIARIKQLAEEAHVAAVSALPVSSVQASKIAGTAVVAGLPDDPDPSKYMTKK